MPTPRTMYRFAPAASLAFILLSACNEPIDPSHIDTKKVRLQIKDNLLAAINAAESESFKASKNPMLKTFTPNDASGNPASGEITDSNTNDPIFAPLFSQLIDSEFGQALFAEANLADKADTVVTYNLPGTLCPKLRDAAGKGPKKEGDSASELDATIAKCQTFLERNQVQLRVTLLGPNDFDLGLLFAVREGQNQKPELISSIRSNGNLISQTLDLKTLNQFASELQRLSQTEEQPALPTFGKLEGALNWTLRFKGAGKPSGCPDQADVCLSLNVDKAVSLEGKMGEDFLLNLRPSSKARPTLYLSSDNDSAFSGQVNVAEISGKAQGEGFLLAGASFDVRLPGLTAAEPVIVIENVQAVNKPSWVEFGGKKIAWTFNQPLQGKINALKIWNKEKEFWFETSPLILDFDIRGAFTPGCEPEESLSLVTNLPKTRFKIAKSAAEPPAPQPAPVLASTRANNAECTTSELLLLLPFKQFESSEQCETGALLLVDQGRAKLTYHYEIAGSKDRLKLEVSKGECVKPALGNALNRSLLPFKIQQHLKKTAMLYMSKSGISKMIAWLKDKAAGSPQI